ncbi:hypothetical protein CNEO4_100066 [Clostridium neonatale]|nr:hypothetical protein CNEO4_100066 [Clostridium neonatale]
MYRIASFGCGEQGLTSYKLEQLLDYYFFMS